MQLLDPSAMMPQEEVDPCKASNGHQYAPVSVPFNSITHANNSAGVCTVTQLFTCNPCKLGGLDLRMCTYTPILNIHFQNLL